MKERVFYRFVSNGEGVFSAGKRLLPESLVDEAFEARKWLPKPKLSQEIRFYFTKRGKVKYEETLMLVHKKYLSNIVCEEVPSSLLEKRVVYEDEWQVAVSQ